MKGEFKNFMTDKYEDEILEGEVSDTEEQEEDRHEPEKYCTLCHRSEKQAGKMIRPAVIATKVSRMTMRSDSPRSVCSFPI